MLRIISIYNTLGFFLSLAGQSITHLQEDGRGLNGPTEEALDRAEICIRFNRNKQSMLEGSST